MAIEIESYAVLSTSHLTELTADIIDPNGLNTAEWRDHLSVIMHADHGFLLYIEDLQFDPADGEEETAPQDLMACVKLARDAGQVRLMFDRDVQAIEELPTYEW